MGPAAAAAAAAAHMAARPVTVALDRREDGTTYTPSWGSSAYGAGGGAGGGTMNNVGPVYGAAGVAGLYGGGGGGGIKPWFWVGWGCGHLRCDMDLLGRLYDF